MIGLTQSQSDIITTIERVGELLLEKNKKYGNSALEPSRIFSQSSSIEQLYVRIDDKLSRIKNRTTKTIEDEDVIHDLIGYLILVKVYEMQVARSQDFVIT